MAEVKEIYELRGAGHPIREIARELDISRNTVRRYLKSPEAMRPKARPSRGSKLDPYTGYIDQRMSEGLQNCVVLYREICARGYAGSYSTVVQCMCGRAGGSVSLRPRSGSRRLQVNRPKWTGGASRTSVRTGGGTVSGYS